MLAQNGIYIFKCIAKLYHRKKQPAVAKTKLLLFCLASFGKQILYLHYYPWKAPFPLKRKFCWLFGEMCEELKRTATDSFFSNVSLYRLYSNLILATFFFHEELPSKHPWGIRTFSLTTTQKGFRLSRSAPAAGDISTLGVSSFCIYWSGKSQWCCWLPFPCSSTIFPRPDRQLAAGEKRVMIFLFGLLLQNVSTFSTKYTTKFLKKDEKEWILCIKEDEDDEPPFHLKTLLQRFPLRLALSCMYQVKPNWFRAFPKHQKSFFLLCCDFFFQKGYCTKLLGWP